MKILILGANGMAGHTISLYFIEKGYSVDTITRRPFSIGNNIVMDVENTVELKELVLSSTYDAVINCVGILNEDAERNKSKAVNINSYLPHVLSDITRGTNTKIIQMSTDCVFSGKKGSYVENAVRDGDTIYDRSKALGEIINDKDLTFRNSIIGPDLNVNGIGLFNWFMKQIGPMKGYEKAIWNGVTTLTLAKAMEAALQENLSGLYHLVGSPINKFELLNKFNSVFKNNEITINPDNQVSIDKTLVNTRNDFNFIVPSYEEMIIEMKEWIELHESLYLHYFN